ncbi:MAG: hydroxylase [Alphaproteobacteria bacterium]|nr:CmcI family methyltransferase [Alphaproteobacteria bacterium]TAD88869.1 MAG: hydroxylase [Alphaproteobacteria bacterium]
MKLTIDTTAQTVERDGALLPLYSREAFELLSDLWVKVGWNEKYSYTFTWFGRPVIQLPEDMIRMQEVIWQLKPDLIIETGVAHGGSLIFYASLLKAIGNGGRVIGIDIEVRPHNRAAIEQHPLGGAIELVIGSSIAPETVETVRQRLGDAKTVLVILDSNHYRDHVRAELEAYCGFVSPGSYIVATDGLMQSLADVPRGQAGWETDNAVEAVRGFLAGRSDFVLERPGFHFNESALDHTRMPTHWPDAWVKRIA